jgi:hypothetical protein
MGKMRVFVATNNSGHKDNLLDISKKGIEKKLQSLDSVDGFDSFHQVVIPYESAFELFDRITKNDIARDPRHYEKVKEYVISDDRVLKAVGSADGLEIIKSRNQYV